MPSFWPIKPTSFEQDAIAQYHLRDTGNRMLFGPIDKKLPESLAILQLALIQPGGITLPDYPELDAVRPEVGGKLFVPEKMAITNQRPNFPDVLVAGNMHLPETEVADKGEVYVQLNYLFAGAVSRAIAHRRGREPLTTLRTRIFEA